MSVQAVTAEEFLSLKFPEPEPLIEGLLHRRDLVALGARRRNGKTTYSSALVTALAIPLPDFLGYPIPKRRRSLMLVLEDDPAGYQKFLAPIIGNDDLGGALRLLTREDFHAADIEIDADNEDFRDAVLINLLDHSADVLILDNLAHLVGADYGDSMRIHRLMKWLMRLASETNCAVIIAAHPRKESGGDNVIRLEDDPNRFFESIMGSSHFVNTTGSLWGLERKDDETTVCVCGRLRAAGFNSTLYIQRNDRGRFEVVDDATVNLPNVLNTPARARAWQLLPTPGRSFTYTEGGKLVKAAMKSASTYHDWMTACRRVKVIVDAPGGKLTKAAGCM